MTDRQIEENKYLWSSGTNDQYLLLALSDNRASPHDCLIFHKLSSTVLRIDDEQLAIAIKHKMVDSGVPIMLLRDVFR
jgi:hypothetical protein